MLILLITGDTLNIMSMIGVILLMGHRRQERDPADRLREVGSGAWHEPARRHHRGRADPVRPIPMTTLALIAGMVPIALGLGEGADFRAPLGRAVIGGTITSTFLTPLVIPTAYEILDELREKATGWLRGAKGAQKVVGTFVRG